LMEATHGQRRSVKKSSDGVVARSSDDDGGASRRWLCLSLEIGIRVVVGKLAAQVNLVPSAPAPTSLLYAQCDGGPPAMDGLGAPDQGASQGPRRSLACSVRRST
jgi:hypothetical protein